MHFHGWIYFEDTALWRLACTSEDWQRCNRLLTAQLDTPFWRDAVDWMNRRCIRSNETCPYWRGDDYVV